MAGIEDLPTGSDLEKESQEERLAKLDERRRRLGIVRGSRTQRKIADDQLGAAEEGQYPGIDVIEPMGGDISQLDIAKNQFLNNPKISGVLAALSPRKRFPLLIAVDQISKMIKPSTKKSFKETMNRPMFPGVREKIVDFLTPDFLTDTGMAMPMKMSDEGGSGVVSSSNEVKKIYPNLKYKDAADNFIKANYKKMSDKKMLEEMTKDADKYFYEIPSNAKSLQQRRLDSLGLPRDKKTADLINRFDSQIDYENVMTEFDSITKDMDLGNMSKKQLYNFFEEAYTKATGLKAITSGSNKKLFLSKIDRFTNDRGFEKLRKSQFGFSQNKTLFKNYLFKNEAINNVVSNNKNIDKTSLSRYLDFIRVSSPNSKKGIDGNFDNFMKEFDLEIKDLKNTDSIFYKQYEYFKKFDKVRDEAGKKIKPFLNQIFPSTTSNTVNNSLQIAHRFENSQIGKTVGEGLAGTGGTPSAYYLDISRFNAEIQNKVLEPMARKALAEGDTVGINAANTALKKIGAEIIVKGVKLGKHRSIEEKLLKLAKKYEFDPRLMKQDGVTLKMMRDLYEGIDIISKGAGDLGVKTLASGGMVDFNHLIRPLGNF